MSDNAKNEALDNLLREGTMSYLDALCALQQFRQEVTDIAIAVFRARLPSLISAIGPVAPLGNISRYYNPDGVGREWDGTWAWIAATVPFPEPLGGKCYLGLTFGASDVGDTCIPYVSLMFQVQSVTFVKLDAAFRGKKSYCPEARYKECAFVRKLENPLTMKAEFEDIMDHVITVWTQLGGWNQLPG